MSDLSNISRTADPAGQSRKIPVLAAMAIVVILACLLVYRLLAQEPSVGLTAPEVQPPRPFSSAMLEVPCWSCPQAAEWPLRFRINLDLLAPLGNGTRNAAEFFALFEKERGPRLDEAKAFMERRSQVPGLEDIGQTVPGDDPLLREAEPWVDQGQMRFYPEIYQLEGMATRIPNLLFNLALARSWIARGVQAEDAADGLEDCRRAIRLGRLLRQEDLILINDLVGLACIHLGSRGIYQIAQRTGDHDLALLASIVIGEAAPQKLLTAQRIAAMDISPFVTEVGPGRYQVTAPTKRVQTLVEMLQTSPDRRFLGEALMGSHALAYHGTPEHRALVRQELEALIKGDDPIIATIAADILGHPPDNALMEEYLRYTR